MPSDTWIVTSYFNPCRYRTRRENFDRFVAGLAAVGAQIFVVEQADHDGNFELPPQTFGLRLKHGSMLWQKERMLNLAVERLPPDCQKIVWLDCDLLFENDEWLELTSRALDSFAVVQPFSEAIRLRQSELPGASQDPYPAAERSFGAVFDDDPELARSAPFVRHGHTGFAWAARRDVLEGLGLYDVCLSGSGDHLMAHIFAGALGSPCIPAMIGEGHAYARHFERWAQAIDLRCQGKLSFIAGRLFHLWHGDQIYRRYRDHNTAVRSFDYDPVRDLRKGPDGLWEWTDVGNPVRQWAEEMLASRREDG